MAININHNNSGTVLLQASDEQNESIFIFPNLGAQVSGKVLVSGVATINDISGLAELTSGNGQSFKRVYTDLYNYAVVQNTPAEYENIAFAESSIALGSSACAVYPNQIAHGVQSNGAGCKQSSQYICAFITSGNGNQNYPILSNYQSGSDYSHTITYLKGDVLARGVEKDALFNFEAVIANGLTSRSIYLNNVTGYCNNITDIGFSISSDGTFILLNASGEVGSTINWLFSMNELKLKVN